MGRGNKFSPEMRERAVRMVLDSIAEHPSKWAAIKSVAAKARIAGGTTGPSRAGSAQGIPTTTRYRRRPPGGLQRANSPSGSSGTKWIAKRSIASSFVADSGVRGEQDAPTRHIGPQSKVAAHETAIHSMIGVEGAEPPTS